MSRRDKKKAAAARGGSVATTIDTLTGVDEGLTTSTTAQVAPEPAVEPEAHGPVPEIGPPVEKGAAFPRPPETAGEPDQSAAPKDDGKIVCPDCEGRFLFSEMVPFIDGTDGGQRGRCKPCAEKLQPAVEEKHYVQIKPVEEMAPAPVAPSEDAAARAAELSALLETPKEKELRAENEALKAQVESMEKALGLAAGGASAGPMPVESRLTRDLADLTEEKFHLERQVASLTEQLEDHHETIKTLTVRMRDFEVLLAFDNPVTDASLPASPEWMLQIATDVAAEAPEALDERGLLLLLVDTLGKGFMHRTTAAGLMLRELTGTPTGAALFALSEAALGVLATMRTTPDEPSEMRKNAISDAWLEVNRTASRATAAVRAEIDRLLALEAQEAASRKPQVPAAGQGRRFQVLREPPKPAEDEGEEDIL